MICALKLIEGILYSISTMEKCSSFGSSEQVEVIDMVEHCQIGDSSRQTSDSCQDTANKSSNLSKKDKQSLGKSCGPDSSSNEHSIVRQQQSHKSTSIEQEHCAESKTSSNQYHEYDLKAKSPKDYQKKKRSKNTSPGRSQERPRYNSPDRRQSKERETFNTRWRRQEVKEDRFSDDVHYKRRKQEVNFTPDLPNGRVLSMDSGQSLLLTLEEDEEVCVAGLCKMTVLCGCCVVMGYQCQTTHKSLQLYSPESNSLLTIKCISSARSKAVVTSVYQSLINDSKITQEMADKLPSKDVAVIKLCRLESPNFHFITTLSPYQQLFGKDQLSGDVPHIQIDIVPKRAPVPRLVINKDHHFVREKWNQEFLKGESPVLISCGGKDSGKSTLNRYLINTTLNLVEEVCYLECDVGQTEFTPPGCVALHCITQPLLGPPFTHQIEPSYCCFFGGVSAMDDPTRYLNCVTQCLEHYRKLEKQPPLVVNTMGWTTGVGLLLLMDILRMVKPDLVVQIDCVKQSINLPTLTPAVVAETQGWLYHKKKSKQMEKAYQKEHNLVVIESVMDTMRRTVTKKLRPADHRNLSLISYLGRGLQIGQTLMSIVPWVVDWTSVAIHICHETVQPSQVLEAINACVVALCQIDKQQRYKIDPDSPWFLKETPVCRCLGFGFVRGIDRGNRHIYIVSPLDLTTLNNVNLLMRGAVNLPEQLLHKISSTEVPYVDITTSAPGASALRQRRHMPRKPDQQYM